MTKKEVELFLLNKKGYLKKSPLKVAEAIWKASPKHSSHKSIKDIEKELKVIKEVQTDLRTASTLETSETSNLQLTYQKVLEYKAKPRKVIFFDIETSPNMVFSWRIGNKVNLSPDDIIKERAIICICWKWADSQEVHSLQWNKGDDKEMLQKFAKVIDSADIVIGQNSDKFDIRWLRARCIYHSIPISPKFQSLDTLKMAKSGFYFNSNKLNYMGQFFGVGEKIKTEYDLWKDIVLCNCQASMKKMIFYCQEDVRLLERVYNKLKQYTPEKRFKPKI